MMESLDLELRTLTASQNDAQRLQHHGGGRGHRFRTQEKTHGPDYDQRKRRYKCWGCNPKRNRAKSTTRKDLCVFMPFLPKICYYFNCFRTCQPPPRVWETISRAGWNSSADAADNPLFAHMPYLWNLRPKHQRIWANPKQTQKIQWPCVLPNGMARKVATNDLLSASALSMKTFCCCCRGKSFCCCCCYCCGSSICCCYSSSC